MKHFTTIITFAAMTALLGCVPVRQFNDLKAEKESYQTKLRDIQGENRKLAVEKTTLEERVKTSDKTIADLQRDTANIYPLYRRVKAANADLNALYEKAIAQSSALASSAAGEKRALAEALTKREVELLKKETDLLRAQQDLLASQRAIAEKEIAAAALKSDSERLKTEAERLKSDSERLKTETERLKTDSERLKTDSERLKTETQKLKTESDKAREEAVAAKASSTVLQGNLTQTQTTLAAREQRVKELEAAIAAQQAKSAELRGKLSSALSGFSSNELSVEQRNGKVYVSLSQELLFASGSTEVNAKGKTALASLASVLNKNPDVQIAVEGHTDNVPFKGAGVLKDNWDLSVLRATSITRLLTNGGVDPRRVTAAGHSEFIPVAENNNVDGKAKNRRTEIILSPKLDELYSILKN
ncbi:MAG: hypothetical protein RI894_597 [Bacteroidota bacterium]|jgi:chemotaxis protein MotB